MKSCFSLHSDTRLLQPPYFFFLYIEQSDCVPLPSAKVKSIKKTRFLSSLLALFPQPVGWTCRDGFYEVIWPLHRRVVPPGIRFKNTWWASLRVKTEQNSLLKREYHVLGFISKAWEFGFYRGSLKKKTVKCIFCSFAQFNDTHVIQTVFHWTHWSGICATAGITRCKNL